MEYKDFVQWLKNIGFYEKFRELYKQSMPPQKLFELFPRGIILFAFPWSDDYESQWSNIHKRWKRHYINKTRKSENMENNRFVAIDFETANGYRMSV